MSDNQKYFACMNPDGNFVIYEDKEKIVWQTNTKKDL